MADRPQPPPIERSPTERKAQAMSNLLRAAERRAEAEADEMLVMRIAKASGVSLRGIADATGRKKDTVRRMLERSSA